MKGKRGKTTLLFYLMLASVYSVGGLIVPDPEDLSLFRETSSPSFRLGKKSVISDGLIWNHLVKDKVVPPEISCTQDGLFPVAGSCHDYYYCKDLASEGLKDWDVLWFTCQEGKIFDVDTLKCLHRSLITGRPECQHKDEEFQRQLADFSNDSLIVEDSHNQDVGGNTEFVGEFSEPRDLSKEDVDTFDGVWHSGRTLIPGRNKRSESTGTCLDVKNIDNYLGQINSQEHSRIPINTDELYSDVMKQYNGNVLTAQQVAGSWTDKNGVLTGIKETLILVTEFELNFSGRVQRTKTLMANISVSDESIIEELEKELNATRDIITTAEEALQQADKTTVAETLLTISQEILTRERENHLRLVKEYNEASKEAEFQELMEILEGIKSKSAAIREKENDTRRKMEAFKRNAQEDYGNFNRILQLAATGKQHLEESRVNNAQRRSEANTKKENLRRSIATERERISALNSQYEARRQDFRRERERLERQAEAGRDKQHQAAIVFAIPFYGLIAGGVLLAEGNAEEKEAHDKIRAADRNYEQVLQIHETAFKQHNNAIKSANDRIAVLEEESRALQDELPQFDKVQASLQKLQDDVNSLSPFLAGAISSLEKMKEVLLGTEVNLDRVISEAGNGHTSAQKRLFSYFTYNKVDEDIQKKWESARHGIISFRDCITTG